MGPTASAASALTRGDNTPDIFVHMETLRRFGLTEVAPARWCWCAMATVRMALWLPKSGPILAAVRLLIEPFHGCVCSFPAPCGACTFYAPCGACCCVSGFARFSPERAAAQAAAGAEILTKTGIRVFQVEFVQTEEQRRVGLMFRKELPDGEGMLFDFARPQPVAMWMRNTIVPLDMIFIRADGTIANIAKNTTPYSEQSIYAEGYVKGVLEVVAGTADRYGIAPGDKVSHRIFRGR